MLITEVRLENVKSFEHEQRIELRQGVNALIGANGAGKSTVVEAIGVALFGELPYKQDDFLRRGARSGQVCVCFVADRDGREYQAVRRFGRGATWYIFDEEIGLRLAEGEKATSEWLHEHLGLDASLDLRAFFRENVGPPQGTLTAPFLGTPAERKARFGPLLQVDGYERAFQELLPAKQYIQGLRTDLEREMEGMKARLERREDVQTAQAQALRRGLEAERRLILLDAEQREAAERRQALDQAEAALKEQQARLDRQGERLTAAERERQQAEALVQEAQQAGAERQRLEPAHQHYLQLEQTLAGLEARRTERDRLLEERNRLARERDRADEQVKQIKAKLQEAEQALDELRRLAQHLPDRSEVGPAKSAQEVELRFQRALEQAQLQVNQAIVAAQAVAQAREVIRAEQPRREHLATEVAGVEREIQRCETARPLAERAEALLSAAASVKQAHADARAALEVAKRARRELSTGLCPILREACQNVGRRSGGDLAEYFRQQLEAGERAVASAGQALAAAETDSERARKATEAMARLPDLRGRLESLTNQAAHLEAQMGAACRTLEEHADAPELLEQAKRRYDQLADQRARAHHLRTLAERAREHRQLAERSATVLEDAEQKLAEAEDRLQPFATVDEALRAARAERAQAQQAHDRYLSLEQVAARRDERQAHLRQAAAQVTAETNAIAEAQAAVARQSAAYDAEAHAQTRERERDLIARVATCRAEAHVARREAAERALELEALEQVERDLAERQHQHEELTEAVLLAEHLRQCLRQAGPQIIRALLARVSEVASRAFSDVMGDHSLELEWRNDYEIVVRQSGVERTFRQLSGGEQMSAALAVRMALHHLLGNLRLLILDEPTTNMDDARRANLAQEVEALKGYDQIILVSHSDEFDGMFGHIVHLAKANGHSAVASELAKGTLRGERTPELQEAF